MKTKPLKLITALLFTLTLQTVQAADNALQQSYQRSYQYEQAQNYDDAIRTLLPSLNSHPKSYMLNLRLGWLHYLAGHYANSIEHYRSATKIKAGSLEAKLGLLLPLLAQQRYSAAEKLAYQIIQIDKNNYYGNLRLISALSGQNKLDLAIRQNNKMRELYPGDTTLLQQAAHLATQQKQHTQATALYGDLLILDPENVTAKAYFAAARPDTK